MNKTPPRIDEISIFIFVDALLNQQETQITSIVVLITTKQINFSLE